VRIYHQVLKPLLLLLAIPLPTYSFYIFSKITRQNSPFRKKLNAHDGDFLVNAFNIAGVVKLKLLGFVKNPAVEPVLAGVLVAPGGAYLFLFYHELL
jgi:hypothetical protein